MNNINITPVKKFYNKNKKYLIPAAMIGSFLSGYYVSNYNANSIILQNTNNVENYYKRLIDEINLENEEILQRHDHNLQTEYKKSIDYKQAEHNAIVNKYNEIIQQNEEKHRIRYSGLMDNLQRISQLSK
jgi:hypothetical protein